MHESDNFFLTIGCDTVELDTIHSLACRRRVHITTTAETENEKTLLSLVSLLLLSQGACADASEQSTGTTN
ncbi:hypothetical protein [Massilia luteola]|uniref:hypothetical protein n=1 Tax=Massilia luteola TaxID=3081751 RepID=UPI002ACC14EB|nr:hypothetical protein [Massilia sp. Gc5]